MAINRIEIKDFLVFKGEFAADFCHGVNVIIGGNATGKTTLLKTMYGIINYKLPSCFYANSIKDGVSYGNGSIKLFCGAEVSIDFNQGVFNEDSLVHPLTGKIQKVGAGMSSYITQGPHEASRLSFENQSVYIPEKEMLSHSPGMLALKHERSTVPFDDTLTDIIAKAQLYPKKEAYGNPLCSKIREIIGGEVAYDNDSFIIVKDRGKDEVTFSMEASGYRKLGLLWKLLRNGLLEPGTILFWDEPENSLNPELIPTLADILLELSRNGVQIFIATHSYDVARWFELNKSDGNILRYFNMRKENVGIVADVADDYASLTNSVIEDAGNQLLRRVTEIAAINAGVKLK